MVIKNLDIFLSIKETPKRDHKSVPMDLKRSPVVENWNNRNYL